MAFVQRGSKRPARSALRAALSGCLAVTALVTGVGGGRALATSTVVQVGLLPATQSSNVYIDTSSRLLYEVDRVLPSGTTISFLDADTFRSLGSASSAGFSPNFFEGIGAVDEVHHRLYIGGTVRDPLTSLSQPAVLTIDGTTKAVVGVNVVGTSGHVVAVAVDAPSGQVYAVAFDPLGGPATITEVATGEGYRVDQCTHPTEGFGRRGGALFLMCSGLGSFINSTLQIPGHQGIFRIRLTDGHLQPAITEEISSIDFFPVPGGYFPSSSGLFDPASGRMMMASWGPDVRGTYIFDTDHWSMVGFLAHEGAAEMSRCLDSTTGRFYEITTAATSLPGSSAFGLLIGESRATPTPPGLRYPAFTSDLPGAMACDPSTHRVFYKMRTDSPLSPPSWTTLILRDDNPAYVPPTVVDPDTNTTNVPDDPTLSTATYEADGRGYGARARLVGGYNNLLFTTISNPNVASLLQGSPTPPRGTRSVTLGSTGMPGGPNNVSLTNASSDAWAVGGARDADTTSDTTFGGTEPDIWPYSPATCSAPAGHAVVTASTAGATATCKPRSGFSSGSADVPASLVVPNVLAITEAASSVTTRLATALGIVTTSTANVGRLVLGNGLVEVDGIESQAIASARGLPQSAAGSYSRSFGRLLVKGVVVCQPCDPSFVVNAINAIPDRLVQALLPAYNATAIQGTPGGYQALVERDPWQQLNDQVLNEESPYDRQVPALRLVIEADAYAHSALVLDLAAPQAAAHRGLHACSPSPCA